MPAIQLTVLGASAARPYVGAPASSAHVERGGTRLLIDCGEGTQVALDACGLPAARLDAVLITHMHGDHVFGLPGLLTSLALTGRTRALTLLGPAALGPFVEQSLASASAYLTYPLQVQVAEPEAAQSRVLRLRDLEVGTVPLRHRVPATGFCVSTPPAGRNIRAGVIEALGIPYAFVPALRAGADFTDAAGRVHPNTALTLPAPPVRALAYLTDTAPLDGWPAVLPTPDLLVHEATFADADAALAARSGHSTVGQAAAFAKAADARQLVLTHRSVRYDEGATAGMLAGAQEDFAATTWASPGGRYEV